MLWHCLKCKKTAESKNPKAGKTKNVTIMLLLKCTVCDTKESKFSKEQEANRSWGSLEIKIPLSKFPFILLLFQEYKMNEIVYNFLFAGDEFIPGRTRKRLFLTWHGLWRF